MTPVRLAATHTLTHAANGPYAWTRTAPVRDSPTTPRAVPHSRRPGRDSRAKHAARTRAEACDNPTPLLRVPLARTLFVRDSANESSTHGADPEREGKRSDADRASEREPDYRRGDLEPQCATRPMRVRSFLVSPSINKFARACSDRGTDVEAGSDADDDDSVASSTTRTANESCERCPTAPNPQQKVDERAYEQRVSRRSRPARALRASTRRRGWRPAIATVARAERERRCASRRPGLSTSQGERPSFDS